MKRTSIGIWTIALVSAAIGLGYDAFAADPNLTWKLSFEGGEIFILLDPRVAPKTVARIQSLTQSGFYKDQPFYKVVPGFLVAGGIAHGMGSYDPEISTLPHLEGTVGLMRGAHPRSGDSQFYILLSRQPNLDQRFTIFGKVISGMDLVHKIKPGTVFTASLF